MSIDPALVSYIDGRDVVILFCHLIYLFHVLCLLFCQAFYLVATPVQRPLLLLCNSLLLSLGRSVDVSECSAINCEKLSGIVTCLYTVQMAKMSRFYKEG